MLLLCFYCPMESKEKVKKALFEAGAGVIGNYDSCSFETEGTGQFRPQKGSGPAIGEIDRLETVLEVKVEMVCKREQIQEVIAALKASHPYETPVFHVLEMLNY